MKTQLEDVRPFTHSIGSSQDVGIFFWAQGSRMARHRMCMQRAAEQERDPSLEIPVFLCWKNGLRLAHRGNTNHIFHGCKRICSLLLKSHLCLQDVRTHKRTMENHLWRTTSYGDPPPVEDHLLGRSPPKKFCLSI